MSNKTVHTLFPMDSSTAQTGDDKFVQLYDPSSLHPIPPVHIFSPKTFNLLLTIINMVGLPAAVLTTGANIITIVTYFKVGFSDATNVSLTALAVSDLGATLVLLCNGVIYMIPLFKEVMFPLDVINMATNWPHLVMIRTSALITAYLSVGRYFCILLPLKIKVIMTPWRTLVVVVFIFIAGVFQIITIYFRFPLGLQYSRRRNRTVLGIRLLDDPIIEASFIVFQAYSSIFLPLFTFIVVTICTILLSLSLRRSKTWRNSNRGDLGTQTSDQQLPEAKYARSVETQPNAKVVSKETKAVKMVVTIATVFMVCSTPSCVQVSVVMVIPKFDIIGRYRDVGLLTAAVYHLANLANATANFFIYYKMSTKFRHAVRNFVKFRHITSSRETEEVSRITRHLDTLH